MLKLILSLFIRPAHRDGRKASEPPSHLSLREMADIPPYHPSADGRS